MLEEDPFYFCERDVPKHSYTEPSEVSTQNDSRRFQLKPLEQGPETKDKFIHNMTDIRYNYKRLYRSFAAFSIWLRGFEQFLSILPFIIAAPLLFSADAKTRISLGVLTRLSNAFGNVFSSLNIISDNWLGLVDWISVTRRLAQWEAHLVSITFHHLFIPFFLSRSINTHRTSMAKNYVKYQ